jgi:hypothetical protein
MDTEKMLYRIKAKLWKMWHAERLVSVIYRAHAQAQAPAQGEVDEEQELEFGGVEEEGKQAEPPPKRPRSSLVETNKIVKLIKANPPIILENDEWKKVEEYVIHAVSEIPLSFFPDFKDNIKIVLAAINTDPWNLQYAGALMKNNEDVVSIAVSKEGAALVHASTEMRNNKTVVCEAVKNFPYALQVASEDMRKDKDVVLNAVRRAGLTLRDARGDMKDAKDVVLAAVSNNGLALEYAGTVMKDDKDVVLAAVSNNGLALEYAGEQMKNNRDIVIAALLQDYSALKLIGQGLIGQGLEGDREVFLVSVLHIIRRRNRGDSGVFWTSWKDTANALHIDKKIINFVTVVVEGSGELTLSLTKEDLEFLIDTTFTSSIHRAEHLKHFLRVRLFNILEHIHEMQKKQIEIPPAWEDDYIYSLSPKLLVDINSKCEKYVNNVGGLRNFIEKVITPLGMTPLGPATRLGGEHMVREIGHVYANTIIPRNIRVSLRDLWRKITTLNTSCVTTLDHPATGQTGPHPAVGDGISAHTLRSLFKP